MTPEPVLRHDWDRYVWRHVYEQNEYHLPDDLSGKLVLDVGGNVGSFARAAAERGAWVVSYEPDPHSLQILWLNVMHLPGRVRVHWAAVLDRGGAAVLDQHPDPAGRSLFRGQGGVCVPVLAFDEIVASECRRTRSAYVDLVKIDAEGAEYPICESSDFLGVRELAVEFHDGYVHDAARRAFACRERLAGLGFAELSWEETHPDLGRFWLYRGQRP